MLFPAIFFILLGYHFFFFSLFPDEHFLFSPQIKVVLKMMCTPAATGDVIIFIKAALYVLLQKLENKIHFIKANILHFIFCSFSF